MYNVIRPTQIKDLQRKAAGFNLKAIYNSGFVALSFEYPIDKPARYDKIYDLFHTVGVEIDTDSMLENHAARANFRHPGRFVDIIDYGHTCIATFNLLCLSDAAIIGENAQYVLRFKCRHCNDVRAQLLHCEEVRCVHALTNTLQLDPDKGIHDYIEYENSSLEPKLGEIAPKPIIDDTDIHEILHHEPHHFECSCCGEWWYSLDEVRKDGHFIVETVTNISYEDTSI
jgi:hypothetical protein